MPTLEIKEIDRLAKIALEKLREAPSKEWGPGELEKALGKDADASLVEGFREAIWRLLTLGRVELTAKRKVRLSQPDVQQFGTAKK